VASAIAATTEDRVRQTRRAQSSQLCLEYERESHICRRSPPEPPRQSPAEAGRAKDSSNAAYLVAYFMNELDRAPWIVLRNVISNRYQITLDEGRKLDPH
jgi:hypothetical protein